MEDLVVVLVKQFLTNEDGQSFLEFSLIIVVLVLTAILAVSTLSEPIYNLFVRTGIIMDDSFLTYIDSDTENETVEAPPLTPLGSTLPEISDNMIERILAYYNEKNKYPSGSGDKAYTDLGLDPADWKNIAYNGIVYKPGGSKLTIYPASGYNFRIIDTNGDTIVISRTNIGLVYSIPNSNTWHYKSATGKIVDIETLEVIYNSS